MIEKYKGLFRGRNNPYRKAAAFGIALGGTAGVIFGAYSGVQFMEHHHFYQSLTDAVFGGLPHSDLLLVLPAWIASDEVLSLVSDAAGAVVGGVLYGALGIYGVIGALGGFGICVGGRALYDITRLRLKK
jgi:hypothetical protein